jgi:antitoxin VapB
MIHTQRLVKLFRSGRHQAVRIPVEFELAGSEALMHKDGDKLVIAPIKKRGLAALLDSWEPMPDALPDLEPQPVTPEDIF